MARMAVFAEAGRPLELVAFAPPQPRAGETLVRVSCCTLCRSDLHTHAGRRIEPTPTVLGHEIVGRIAVFGPDTPRIDANGDAIEVGTRISWAVAVGCGSCFFCENDLPQKCEQPYKYGHHRLSETRPLGGGLADHILLVPGTVIYKLPDELTDDKAAPANCATATIAAMLRSGGSVEGRAAIVLGAGVLGVTACAMLRASGASEVTAVDPNESSRDRALMFGATHAVASVKPGGRGADVVFELAGAADSVRTAIDSARIGGMVILAGTVSPVGTVPLDPEQLVRRLLTIRGVHNYHPRDLGTALAFLAGPGRAYDWGSLVAARHPLADVEGAFAEAHRLPGMRVAVIPGEDA